MTLTYVCCTCGTQYPPGIPLPVVCMICSDDRQYIGEGGRTWISMEELTHTSGMRITSLRKNLYSLTVQPDFALANRALLVRSSGGNILWDCVPLLDKETIGFIHSIGGLQAIAISHPHYYTAMNVWAKAFHCPIYLHEKDSDWIVYRGEQVRCWAGDHLELWDGMVLTRTGGHFPGSCVLQVPGLSAEGTLLSGDSLYLSRSKKHLSVMYSYPNYLLLSRDDFASFYEKTQPLLFDTFYGAFAHQNLEDHALSIFQESMQRYLIAYGLKK